MVLTPNELIQINESELTALLQQLQFNKDISKMILDNVEYLRLKYKQFRSAEAYNKLIPRDYLETLDHKKAQLCCVICEFTAWYRLKIPGITNPEHFFRMLLLAIVTGATTYQGFELFPNDKLVKRTMQL